VAVVFGGSGLAIFAGQVMVGGVKSLTVKVVVQVVVLPASSLTVTVIVVVPEPTVVPAAGLCVIINNSGGVQRSDAVTPLMTSGTTAQLLPAVTVVPAGQLAVGAVMSATVTVAVQVASPAEFSAVMVTV
jgi:hypothetical protein